MKRRFIDHNLVAAIMHFIFGTVAACGETLDKGQTQAAFERLAAELPYLSLSSVIHDSRRDYFQAADPTQTEKHFQVIDKVTDGTHAKDSLIGLSNHADAKVRTLAAVALFDFEDPAVLPELVRLTGDDSTTFDGHPEISQSWLASAGSGPPRKQQTVGDIARSMVSFYMTRAGFYYGIEDNTQPGFREYWATRKNRSHCASWFSVQLARAMAGTSPAQKECLDRIRLLRTHIDKLAADERAWTLLWLNGESGSDALVTEEELIHAAKSLRPDKLLLMLRKKIPSDDPDLQPRSNNNWPYKRMQLFVLRHANLLLRSRDSVSLLECETWERDYQKHGISDPTITSWWAAAAARLEPANASAILHAAIKRFQGEFDSEEQATLCFALWQLCGEIEMKFIKDWFFESSPQRGSFPNCRGQFIEAISKEPSGKQSLADIIQDNRLEKLDWQSLRRLVIAVNLWTSKPIIAEEELREVGHPLGEGHYDWEKDKARELYPKETKELEENLSLWRKRLRDGAADLLK